MEGFNPFFVVRTKYSSIVGAINIFPVSMPFLTTKELLAFTVSGNLVWLVIEK